MVKKFLFSAFFVAFSFCSPGYSSELGDELIIKEIEETFAEDILSSKYVNERRKYFRANPEAFENGPARIFLQHSDAEMTLKTIIGKDNFSEIPEHNLDKIINALNNTFRRYAYEWLNSNLNTSLSLKKISLIDQKSGIIIVKRSLKVVPDLDLKLFIHKTYDGWKLYDFGFWDFRYSKMKRRLYLRYINNNEIEGLIKYLEYKNYKFFKKTNNFIVISP